MKTLRERIEDNYIVAPNGCWIWTLASRSGGYGYVKVNGRTRVAHRVSYEAFVGPIPDGLQLDHLCRVRDCVNWRHLEPVTPRENQRRSPISPSALNGRKESCLRGHAFAGDNLIVMGDNSRRCRTCFNEGMLRHIKTEKARARRRLAKQRYYQKHKARVLAYLATYREQHREELRANQRAYNARVRHGVDK